MTLPVSEVFGPVYQGEGPHTGRRCSFLRLGLCNLRCTWCDTPFTWDTDKYDVHAECPPMTDTDIIAALATHDTTLLVLSGGEPLIHQRSDTLLRVLSRWQGEVHVETNGTLEPTRWMRDRVGHFTVSPKLANQGDPHDRRIKAGPLRTFAVLSHLDRACFKFVACQPHDLDEIARLVRIYNLPADAVWVMPEGTDARTLLERATILEPLITERGWNLTLRQHVLLHGNERGW